MESKDKKDVFAMLVFTIVSFMLFFGIYIWGACNYNENIKQENTEILK